MSDAATVEAAKPAQLTARLAVHPSAIIRPVPNFVFSVPRGWLVDEAPDALAVVRTPDEVDGFWPNAILSHDRVARAVDFDAAAKVTFAKLKRTNPEATVGFERVARFGTNIVYLRGVELKAPKSGRDLAQLHALFFAPAEHQGKTVDFFQIIATSLAASIERFTPPFLEVIGSFRFT